VLKGYAPYENCKDSACDTLSYAYDDWAIHNVAAYLKKSNIADDYYNRSLYFENVYDPQSRFFCPRYGNGTFNCPHGLGLINPFD
jgi:putative alpha-1,2-mannosidase